MALAAHMSAFAALLSAFAMEMLGLWRSAIWMARERDNWREGACWAETLGALFASMTTKSTHTSGCMARFLTIRLFGMTVWFAALMTVWLIVCMYFGPIV